MGGCNKMVAFAQMCDGGKDMSHLWMVHFRHLEERVMAQM